MARRPGFPLVAAELIFLTGSSSGDKPGVAQLAWEFAERKRRNRGYLTWDYGGRMSPWLKVDSAGWSASAASGNLPNLLAILSETVQSQNINRISKKSKLFKKFEILESTPSYRAEVEFKQAILGSHPYSDHVPVSRWSTIKKKHANAWLERSLRPKNAILALVGEIDLIDTKEKIAEWFGDWHNITQNDSSTINTPPLSSAPDTVDPGAASAPRVILVDEINPAQTHVSLGCVLPPAKSTDAPHHLLAKLVELQLNNALQREPGMSYGLLVRAEVLRGGTAYLTVQGSMGNNRLREGLSILRNSWDQLSRKIDPTELDWARWNLIGEYNTELDTNAAIAQKLVEARKNDFDISVIGQYPDKLAAITAEQLQPFFKQCHGATVITLQGEKKIIKTAADTSWLLN